MRTGKGLRRIALWRLVALLLPWVIGYSADPVAAVKTFTSIRGGYVVDYPSTWQVLDRSLPTLYIVNFPPSHRIHAVTLPRGGASIAVVPPPSGVLNAEQWSARDVKPGMSTLSKANIVLTRPATGASLNVTQAELTWGRPGVEFENVNCYFVVSGHLFVGRLTYWKGDSKAAEYLRVLHEVIESLNALAGLGRQH